MFLSRWESQCFLRLLTDVFCFGVFYCDARLFVVEYVLQQITLRSKTMKFMMEWDSNSIINKWIIRQLQDAKKESPLYVGIFWKVTFGSELLFGSVVIDKFRIV